jgi:hypothetical protein
LIERNKPIKQSYTYALIGIITGLAIAGYSILPEFEILLKQIDASDQKCQALFEKIMIELRKD